VRDIKSLKNIKGLNLNKKRDKESHVHLKFNKQDNKYFIYYLDYKNIIYT
jgi:hypothetical protein